MKRTLTCRVDGCDVQNTFESIEEVNNCDWTEMSQFSVNGTLRGWCPGHSLE